MKYESGPSEFLSGERSSPEEISRRRERIVNDVFYTNPVKDMLDCIFDMVLVLDENRQTVFSNKSLLKYLSLENADSLIGFRPGEVFRCIHAEGSKAGCGTTSFCRFCGTANAILAAQTGKRGTEECTVLQRDGGAIELAVSTSPLDVEGENFVLFAIRDISDQKRRESLERVFFHDVLNVAGVLWSLAEMLKDGPAEKTQEFADKMYAVTSRLIDEIQAQRSLIRAEDGDLEVQIKKIGSLDIVNQTAELYKNHDVARSKSITIDESSENIEIESDPVLLQRVVGNILKNALEATDPNTVVEIGCRRKGAAVEFWVHNDRFMPDDIQKQIFKRSFSTKGKGRGLGTYSIKLLTERYLKGDVSFESSDSGGTTFYARYPVYLADQS